MEITNYIWSLKSFIQLFLGLSTVTLPTILLCVKRLKDRDIVKEYLQIDLTNNPNLRSRYGDDLDEFLDNIPRYIKFEFLSEFYKISLRPILFLSIINLYYFSHISSLIYAILVLILFYFHEYHIGEKLSKSLWYRILISILWISNYLNFTLCENGIIK